jgi:hypothetical protein
MKKLRCYVMATVLALSVSAVAFAGDIQGVGGYTPPPPPPPSGGNSGKAITAIQDPSPNDPLSDDLLVNGEITLVQFLTQIF